jgi:hypothetical protein
MKSYLGNFLKIKLTSFKKKKKHIWDETTIIKSLKFRFALDRNGMVINFYILLDIHFPVIVPLTRKFLIYKSHLVF